MIDKTALVHVLETQQAVCGCSFEAPSRIPARGKSFWEMSRNYFTPSQDTADRSESHDGGAENLRRLVEGKSLANVVDKQEKR